MKAAASCLVAAAFVLLALPRARAQVPSSNEPEQPWYECRNGDAADPTCEIESKSVEDRDNPDAPFALTMGYGVRLASGPDARIGGALPPIQWTLGFALDVKRWAQLALAFEVQYALEGQTTRKLYGGDVSMAMTVHQFAFGPVMRMVVGESAEPNLGLFLRVAPGGAIARLHWRDALSTRDSTEHDTVWFVVTGLGATVRPAGLSLEGGVIHPFQALELEQPGSVEKQRFSIEGCYLRLSLSIRVP